MKLKVSKDSMRIRTLIDKNSQFQSPDVYNCHIRLTILAYLTFALFCLLF